MCVKNLPAAVKKTIATAADLASRLVTITSLSQHGHMR